MLPADSASATRLLARVAYVDFGDVAVFLCRQNDLRARGFADDLRDPLRSLFDQSAQRLGDCHLSACAFNLHGRALV